MPNWIMKRQTLWGVLILFALVMLINFNQEQAKQHAIDERCNHPYAGYTGNTKTLSQLGAEPDFFRQFNESIWRAKNCKNNEGKR